MEAGAAPLRRSLRVEKRKMNRFGANLDFNFVAFARPHARMHRVRMHRDMRPPGMESACEEGARTREAAGGGRTGGWIWGSAQRMVDFSRGSSGHARQHTALTYSMQRTTVCMRNNNETPVQAVYSIEQAASTAGALASACWDLLRPADGAAPRLQQVRRDGLAAANLQHDDRLGRERAHMPLQQLGLVGQRQRGAARRLHEEPVVLCVRRSTPPRRRLSCQSCRPAGLARALPAP